jgi:PAS domain S-box-containing protein
MNDITRHEELSDRINLDPKEIINILSNINDAITIHDKDFNITHANKAAIELLGIDEESVLSQKCHQSYHGTNSPPDACPSCRVLKTVKSATQEVFEPNIGKHLEIRAFPRLDDEHRLIGLVHIVRDISERKHIEEKLKESEKRVRVLNKHIVNMLMAMSHDIRGPFVSIMATLKLLIRGSYGKIDESVTNTLKDLLARIRHLQGIAEDCLGKAHSVEGALKIEREVLDLREDIIDSILEELSGVIQEEGITIDNRLGAIPAGTIPVSANKTWLRVVIRNLFMNAIKYGGKGCTIAFGFEDQGTYYRLNVYNSGKPVAERDRDKLFKKFGRIGADAEGSHKGIGLGLYLVKDIVQKHGGDIWYEAKDDGSDFVFILPKSPE